MANNLSELFVRLKDRTEKVHDEEKTKQHLLKCDREFIRGVMWPMTLINCAYVFLMTSISYVTGFNTFSIVGLSVGVFWIGYWYGKCRGQVEAFKEGLRAGSIAVFEALKILFDEGKDD